MLVTEMRCEICDKVGAQEQGTLSASMRGRVYTKYPPDWISVVIGQPNEVEPLHFCSDKCLMTYFSQRVEQNEQGSADGCISSALCKPPFAKPVIHIEGKAFGEAIRSMSEFMPG